jgi:WD40 repeat protein
MTTVSRPAESTVVSCPYLGLMPYGEEQAAFFFGRERDTGLIADNLIAYQLTLLYGPSGVGKSSILGAGVAPLLRDPAVEDLSSHRPPLVVILSSWRDDPLSRLDAAVRGAARQIGIELESKSPSEPLRESVARWSRTIGSDLYFIFDQFEEYFLYHADRDDRFAVELGEALGDARLAAHFLIAIREDALASLDRFQGRIPSLFDNYYRLEHLRVDEARRAIIGPLEEYNRRGGEAEPVQIELSLIDDVLAQVRAGQVVVESAGVGRVTARPESGGIETAHLQLVMTRLWTAERATGSSLLGRSTLQALGGAAAIVRSHLDDSMGALDATAQDLAAAVFRQLVTPSGTKIAHSAEDLAIYADATPAALSLVLERLCEGDLRILRPVPPAPDHPRNPRYEIFHDALASAVLDWRTRHEQGAREAATQSELDAAHRQVRRERRHRIFLTLVAVVLLGLLVATVGFFLHSRNETRARQNESRARQADNLANKALVDLPANPTVAGREVLDAWNTDHTATVQSALRRIAPEVKVERALVGHTGPLNGATFSPDGTTILTMSDDGTGRLWDAASGRQIGAPLTGHTSAVVAGRFTPDGSLVVTASFDNTIGVWNAHDGSSVRTLQQPSDGMIDDIAVGPDSHSVAVANHDGSATWWDLKTGAEITTVHPGAAVYRVAFLPDGGSFVTADGNGTVKVWLPSGELLMQEPNATKGWASALAVSPDGNLIAFGNGGGAVFLWRWRAGLTASRLSPVDSSFQPVGALRFSPDSRELVATASKFGYLWQLPEPGGRADAGVELGGHVDWVNDAAFSPDGQFVVTASSDDTAVVHDAQTGVWLGQLRGHGSAIATVDVGPDGRILTASNDGTARLWDAPATTAFRGHESWVVAFAINAAGSRIVSGSADNTVRVWDPTGRQVAELKDGDTWLGFVTTVAFHPDGHHVAVAGDTGVVRVWDLDANPDAPVATWTASFKLAQVAFDPTGDTLAIGAASGGVHFWKWQQPGEPLVSVSVAQSPMEMAWSPNGHWLATAAADGLVVVWDAATRAKAAVLTGHTGAVAALSFSPDGRHIVSAGFDDTARIWSWDGTAGHLEWVLSGHQTRLSSAVFSPDGTRVATGAADGTIGIWDSGTGRNLAMFRAHGDSVNAVALLDDDRVMSSGDDQVLRLTTCTTCGSVDEVLTALQQRVSQVPAAPPFVLRDQSVEQLATGQCFPDVPTGVIYRMAAVPCTRPHHVEVIGSLDLPEPAATPYPGQDALAAESKKFCASLYFQDYVGIPADQSQLTVRAIFPTKQSWSNDLRAVTCFVGSTTELTTSARGART